MISYQILRGIQELLYLFGCNAEKVDLECKRAGGHCMHRVKNEDLLYCCLCVLGL